MELQRKASRHLQRAQELLGFGAGDDSSQDGERHPFTDITFDHNLMAKIEELKKQYEDQSEKLNDFEGIKEHLIEKGKTNVIYLNRGWYDEDIEKYVNIVPKQELKHGLLQPIKGRMDHLKERNKWDHLAGDKYNKALECIKAAIAKEKDVNSFGIEIGKFDSILIRHMVP